MSPLHLFGAPFLTYDDVNSDVYGIDLFDTSKEQIAAYHKQGKKVVCYFSAGSWESGRPDSSVFLPKCYCNKSSKCKMQGWPEYWLSISDQSCIDNINDIMAKRIALAKVIRPKCMRCSADLDDNAQEKGCDAVEAVDALCTFCWR